MKIKKKYRVSDLSLEKIEFRMKEKTEKLHTKEENNSK